MKPVQCVARLLLFLWVSSLPGAAWAQTAVQFADARLEAIVRLGLGKPTGALTSTDLLSLRMLGATGQGITSLAGLEGARNLQMLSLDNNAVEDLTPLAGLTALRYLFLDYNQISDCAPLAGLTNLNSLLLQGNAIHELSWVTGLYQLRELRLVGNRPLEGGAVLGGLTNLQALYINDTGISDLSWVSGLSQLTRLGVGENGVIDASPVAALTKLEFLGLGGNPLGSCEVVAGLTNLNTLYLFDDGLTDVRCLAGLKNLTWLRLADNQLSDVSPLADLTQLQYLDLSHNPLSDCTPVASLVQLTGLDLSRAALTGLSCLSGLSHLADLRVNDNQIVDASALADLTSLRSLNLSSNRLSNLNFAQTLTALTNLDVSHNQLTDVNGLLGPQRLSSVVLNGNPLDLAYGSPAYNVVQALQDRGVALDLSVQSLPFLPSRGTYNGLAYAGDALTPADSGFITLTTTAQGKYTGKLRFGGRSYGLHGALSAGGLSSQTINRGKLPPLLVNLAFISTNALTGTISASTETWTAQIEAYRAAGNLPSSSRSFEPGRYTLILAGGSSPGLPAGNGYGTLTVSPQGRLSFVGSLADGSRLSQSAWLSAYGRWPLYVPLYSGQGAILSWLTFTNAQTLGGDLAWVKPSGSAKCYPGGFAWVTQVVGARYNPPAPGVNAFGLSDCTLTLNLSGGGLPEELADSFSMNGRNRVKALVPGERLQLTFKPSCGLFSGRAVDPNTHQGVAFGGVLLQNQASGCGYFLGASTSGQVLLRL